MIRNLEDPSKERCFTIYIFPIVILKLLNIVKIDWREITSLSFARRDEKLFNSFIILFFLRTNEWFETWNKDPSKERCFAIFRIKILKLLNIKIDLRTYRLLLCKEQREPSFADNYSNFNQYSGTPLESGMAPLHFTGFVFVRVQMGSAPAEQTNNYYDVRAYP